jgi:hypothetical protein
MVMSGAVMLGLFKRAGAVKTQHLPGGGVRQFQCFCVQQQAGGQRLLGQVGVQRVAQNGVPQGLQVHAQLVCAAGDGFQFYPRADARVCRWGLGGGLGQAPARQAGLAGFNANFAARAVDPVHGQRQVDGVPAVVGLGVGVVPGLLGQVALVHLALF